MRHIIESKIAELGIRLCSVAVTRDRFLNTAGMRPANVDSTAFICCSSAPTWSVCSRVVPVVIRGYSKWGDRRSPGAHISLLLAALGMSKSTSSRHRCSPAACSGPNSTEQSCTVSR